MFKLGGSPFTPEDFKEGTDLALVASAIEYLNSTEHRKIDRYSDSKELLSEYEAHHAHFLLSYATGLHSYRKGGCHYNLQYTDSGCHLVSTKVTMSMVAKEDLVDLKLYYDWLMNESPWADAFLSKTYHEDYPWLFLRTDIPSNFLASACIASRQTWENGSRFTLWRSLVNKGLDKSYAFFLMCSFGYGGFYTGSLGHCPLFPFALQRTQALSFARKQYLRDKRKARPLYVNNTVYSSDYVKVYDVFRDESNEFTSDLFDKLLDGIQKYDLPAKASVLFNGTKKTLEFTNPLSKKKYPYPDFGKILTSHLDKFTDLLKEIQPKEFSNGT